MSITFAIGDGLTVHCAESVMTFDVFKELTGSKIDLNRRIGKRIVVQRSKGHLYFYDTEFIVGEYYIYDSKPYRCSYINKNGTAILSCKMHTITMSEPLALRIA